MHPSSDDFSTNTDHSTAAPVRRTQTERREASEQRILEAALELVAHKGTARVTLAEIGIKAGYSRGLPAARFGSKAKLLAALANYIGERFGEHRRSYNAQPGLASVDASIRAYFTRKEWNNTRALIIMLAESALGDPELQPILAAYNSASIRYITEHIQHAQQTGQARPDVDAQTLAMVVLSTFRGAMLQWLNNPSINLSALRDEVIALIHARLKPQ